MKSKAFCLAFPRKSRLGTLLSLAITASLLTPLVPGAFSAGAPAPRKRKSHTKPEVCCRSPRDRH